LVTPPRVPLSNRLGGKSCTQHIPQNVLTLSRKVDECKSLLLGHRVDVVEWIGGQARTWGLHSSTFQLNLSRFCH
jgi:hypothetical protein